MTALEDIAQGPRLRAAINTGNRALVQERNGTFHGVSPALARRLAEAIGKPLECIRYEGAGAVVADAGADRWDVAFLAVDPARANVIAFTRAYHLIEAIYAVRTDSPIRDISEIDRLGQVVMVAKGSAYDLHLSQTLCHAELLRAASPGDSFRRFAAGEGDVVAGVRQSLEGHFADVPGMRFLDGAITQVAQAMALPVARAEALSALDRFVSEAISDGFVASAL
ncbi:MAG: polar amino acid transport system substrate-binding protein [Limimaricola cinnabarinus]|jgi:polar amino acid transport system substrate-binding protein|uniref:transporter substrate-binding domain-containing protein n=1 Tax=Limimaricola cinnabarinus TaxID=1125964 RepID=UPI0039E22601